MCVCVCVPAKKEEKSKFVMFPSSFACTSQLSYLKDVYLSSVNVMCFLYGVKTHNGSEGKFEMTLLIINY